MVQGSEWNVKATHQSFIILLCSPVTQFEAAAEKDCEDDRDAGEDDVAGDVEEGGADQTALDVPDAGELPPVRAGVLAFHCHVDPEETVRVERLVWVESHVNVTWEHHQTRHSKL